MLIIVRMKRRKVNEEQQQVYIENNSINYVQGKLSKYDRHLIKTNNSNGWRFYWPYDNVLFELSYNGEISIVHPTNTNVSNLDELILLVSCIFEPF